MSVRINPDQPFGRTNELKPLPYTFRALLTGIHLMRTGAIEADLSVLVSELHRPSFLPEHPSAEPDLHRFVVSLRLTA